MADEDIEVEITDSPTDGAEVVKTNGATPPAAEDPVKALKTQFDDIQGKYDIERTQREAAERRASDAERRAQDAAREADEARTRVTESEIETVSSGIEAAKTAADAAEQEYARAFESGDVKAMAKAQRSMARAEAEIMRLDEAKSTLDARKTEKKVTKTEERPAADDPVEAWIAGRAPEAQRWLRSHKNYLTDAKLNARLQAAHFAAVADDIEINSPSYFESIEAFLGLKQPTKTDANDREHKADGKFAPKRTTPPTAPVNGASTAGGGESSANTVRLTKAEATAATDGTVVWNYDDPSGQKRFKKGDPVGVQEYARRKLAMQKRGLYDKSYTEA
jgi:hypothetical protein